MCAVPLVIDRIYKGIHENINTKGIFFKKLMSFFYKYKSYYRQKVISYGFDSFIFQSSYLSKIAQVCDLTYIT